MSENETLATQSRVAERPGDGARNGVPTLLPLVDVVEDSTGLTLFADLPGVPKESLGVRVDADHLTIEGDLGIATPQGMSSSHAEVQSMRYRRVFALSKEIDTANIDAELKNGVLRLRLPKVADSQHRRIPVAVH